MKSMTGYGFAEARCAGMSVRVEISSLNKKGLEQVVNLPRNLMSLELDLRKLIQQHLSRGRILLSVYVNRTDKAAAPSLPVDEKVLKQYYAELGKLAGKIGCSGAVDLPFLFTLPGVIDSNRILF